MIRWAVRRWLQWEALMFAYGCWRDRRKIRDAIAEALFAGWAQNEFPVFWDLLVEGQRRAREGPDEALDDWYVVRHGFPPDRLEALCHDPVLGPAARYARDH